ncbi:MAG: hydrogenase formation protein HypD [Anaerolineales bacterium]|nr:hydrogenase formation protein HypD [Anaerolineales bacterium]
MKYIDEFRDPQLARSLLASIRARSQHPVRFMEFCGGHTHAIFRHGLRQLLPPTVELRSGPGCPVCVTADSDIDRAIALAKLPGVVMTTFGDMLKVPGSYGSLQTARAEGADVRIVYSTLDALQIARENPARQVVFLGIGFETTAPTVAASLLQADSMGLTNFYVLSLHKTTPPATRAILDAGEVRLSGIIGPGHVTAVIGSQAWEFLPREYGVPCAVAGFEPLDILKVVDSLVEMAESGHPAVVNAYSRGVRAEGNATALAIMDRVFKVSDAEWRGLGRVPNSGLALRPEYARCDAALAFPVEVPSARPHSGCRCGEVLRGVIEPSACRLFGHACTPAHPVGPCMVSAEGACAAWFQYGDVDA